MNPAGYLDGFGSGFWRRSFCTTDAKSTFTKRVFACSATLSAGDRLAQTAASESWALSSSSWTAAAAFLPLFHCLRLRKPQLMRRRESFKYLQVCSHSTIFDENELTLLEITEVARERSLA